jgi:hypothetical protein
LDLLQIGLVWACPVAKTRFPAFLVELAWLMAGVCHPIEVFSLISLKIMKVILIVQNEGRETYRVSLPQKELNIKLAMSNASNQ